MITSQARYDREDFPRRGQDIYERNVQATLQPGDDGKFVAIDIESGDFEINGDDYTATERLLGRHPDAQIWLTQVGRQAAYRLGGRSISGVPE